ARIPDPGEAYAGARPRSRSPRRAPLVSSPRTPMTSAAVPAPRSGIAPRRHPVDQVPPPARLTVLSLQHVLAFYAGAVIVPLLIASGLGLTPEQTIHLINADLFTRGIATLIQRPEQRRGAKERGPRPRAT